MPLVSCSGLVKSVSASCSSKLTLRFFLRYITALYFSACLAGFLHDRVYPIKYKWKRWMPLPSLTNKNTQAPGSTITFPPPSFFLFWQTQIGTHGDGGSHILEMMVTWDLVSKCQHESESLMLVNDPSVKGIHFLFSDPLNT